MRRAAAHVRRVIRAYATKRSPYAVLGVDRGATEREIKHKFRALAKALPGMEPWLKQQGLLWEDVLTILDAIDNSEDPEALMETLGAASVPLACKASGPSRRRSRGWSPGCSSRASRGRTC